MTDRYRKYILLLGDIVVMYLALALALLVRNGDPGFMAATWNQHFWSFSLLIGIWVVVMYIDGFYAIERLRQDTRFLAGLLRVVGFNLLAGVVFFYAFNAFGITPKTVLLLHVGFFAVLLLAWRGLANRIFRFSSLRRPAVLLEMDGETARLAADITDDPLCPFRVVGVCDISQGGAAVCRLVREKGAETVVVGDRAWRSLPPELYDLALTGVRVIDASGFAEEHKRRLPLENDDLAWFLAGFRDSRKPEYEASKRTVDAVLAVAMGLALSPLLLLIAASVKLAGGAGPVLFTQRRVGRFGREFTVIKFRTMVDGAEDETGPRWSSGRGDARVTRLGRFLRHSHLDETPQLWNILRGEMSFVGPRPERPVFVEQLKEALPFYGLRHLIRPGVSGWAQINYPYGASVEDAATKLTYDLWYVKNRSAAVDLKIFLKTVAMLFRGEGR